MRIEETMRWIERKSATPCLEESARPPDDLCHAVLDVDRGLCTLGQRVALRAIFVRNPSAE